MNKKHIIIFLFLLLLFLILLFRPLIFQNVEIPELSKDTLNDIGLIVPDFDLTYSGSNHNYDGETYSFLASSIIDYDGDGMDEIFIGSSRGQTDKILDYDELSLKFNEIDIDLNNDSATFGSVSIDIDNDLDVDLIVAREDGVFFYINENNIFIEKKVNINFDDNSIPMSFAITDLNNDGYFDIYVNTFIKFDLFKSGTFNDESHKTKNIMLLNNRDNTFTDVTNKYGLNYNQNTFLSYFIDLDGDRLQDLVISPNTDKIVLFKNLGNSFQKIDLSDIGYWMGSVPADFDNDGDFDLFFSNIGNSIPNFIAKGDLLDEQILQNEWVYYENLGNFNFKQRIDDIRLDNYEFGWGANSNDFNMDGKMDLIVSENYLNLFSNKITKAPGRLLLMGDDNKFIPSTMASKVSNFYYGQNVLSGFFNDDNIPDVVYVNMDGPVRIFLNKDLNYNYLMLNVPDTLRFNGAIIELIGNKFN
ncbi:VCBS repeat-containing protein, partial [Candidatus Woesearchaeota archaeon]|nr:VCBS repeat-containing protein [Candidatus Woesearchaeota archaeon]